MSPTNLSPASDAVSREAAVVQQIENIANAWKGANSGIYAVHGMSLELARWVLARDAALPGHSRQEEIEERIGRLEEERATVVRFVTRIHDALADPSRPRQSVGEMVARLLSDMEARARALLPTQEPPRDAR
jgi:hypothetical protein